MGRFGIELIATIGGAGSKLFENERKLFATGLQTRGPVQIICEWRNATRSKKRRVVGLEGIFTAVIQDADGKTPTTHAKNCSASW